MHICILCIRCLYFVVVVFGICDFPVDRRAGLAPVLVLRRAGISPASAPDLRRELSSLMPVLVLHRSRRTPLTLASGGHQGL